MKRHILSTCFLLVHLLAYAQPPGSPVPFTITIAGRGIVVSDTPTCYLDSVHRTRGRSIQDIATVRNKTFAVPWSRFYDRLIDNPRPYVFWLQVGLRNDGDSARELSLAYANLDFVDAWLIPQPCAPAGHPTGPSLRTAGLPLPPRYVSAGALRTPPPGASYLQRLSRTIPLRLPPHASARLLIRVRQLTDDYFFDGFALYDQESLGAGVVKDLPADNAFLVIQMLFQGFLLCQLLYVLVQWFIVRRKEYWYYFLYMLLIAGYFLSKQEALFGVRLLFTRWPLLRIYLGKTLLILPYYVYFRFIRSFLDFPRDYPRLNYWVIRLEYFLLAYAVLDFLYILLTFNRGVQTLAYTVVFSMVFLISLGFTIYLVRYRRPLIYFILTGSLIVATGHILGLVFSYLEIERHIDLGVPDIFVFPQCGIVLEILCFTAGLSYKNRKIEQEKIAGQEKLIEQLKANELLQTRMQHIRNKIAQDLHDDIGSTLSSISILSDLAIRGDSSSRTMETMGVIKDSSLMLMERMDDIVWSINPRNDSLENLLMRVRHFATTLFEAKGVDYTIDIAKNIHEVRLPMDYRQHIYLILKEAINNLVKYAHATEAFIEVRFDQRHLTLCVRDNGCGFEVPASAGSSPGPGFNRNPIDSGPSPSLSDPGHGNGFTGPSPGIGNAPGSSGSGEFGPNVGSTNESSPRGASIGSSLRGNGLPGMYYRASLMNARLDITSTPGQGTSIRLQVDLA
jgi:signal transduction histidine kinase